MLNQAQIKKRISIFLPLGLITLIALGALTYYVPRYGLIYDGGLYASLGYSLANDHSYQFNGGPGDIPPFYPILLAGSILLLGEKGVFVVTPFFSLLMMIGAYLFLSQEFDRILAALASLSFFFTPPLFYYSLNVVRDTVMIALVILAYALVTMKIRTQWKEVLLGLLSGMAFLTKYVALLYLVPLFIYARKGRYLKKPLLITLVFIAPWMIWSQLHHGTALVSHSSYLTTHVGTGLGEFLKEVLPLFISWAPPPLILAAFLGFLIMVREEGILRGGQMSLLLIVFLTALFWPVQDVRYLLLAYFPLTYLAFKALGRLGDASARLMLILLVLFQGASAVALAHPNTYQNKLFEDAGLWLRDNTPENSLVLATSYRQISYFSHRRTYQPPENPNQIKAFIEDVNASYAVVYLGEKYAPRYMDTYFHEYPVVKSFEKRSERMVIYDLRRPKTLQVLLSFDFESPEGVEHIPNILNVLRDNNAKATFFVTGSIARDYPRVIKSIKAGGHDIGSHGYYHEYPIFSRMEAGIIALAFQATPDYVWTRSVKTQEEFLDVLNRSREEIKKAIGRYPRSYRSPLLAPSYTRNMSYLETLAKAGFIIDSSFSNRFIKARPKIEKGLAVVPASISDSEIDVRGYVLRLAREHVDRDQPFVIFFHPWRFREKGHLQDFKELFNLFEEGFDEVQYISIEGYADCHLLNTSPREDCR